MNVIAQIILSIGGCLAFIAIGSGFFLWCYSEYEASHYNNALENEYRRLKDTYESTSSAYHE